MQSNSQKTLTAAGVLVSNRTENSSGGAGGWRHFFSTTAGNTVTEFALVLPIFLMMVCGITDFSRIMYQQTTLQNAVRAAGRYATTGNHQADPKNQGQNLSRVASIQYVAQQAALGLNVTNIQISSTTGGSGSAGGPLDTVTVSLTSNVKLLTPIIAQFFPNKTCTFTVSATYKNEPFPPSLTT